MEDLSTSGIIILHLIVLAVAMIILNNQTNNGNN